MLMAPKTHHLHFSLMIMEEKKNFTIKMDCVRVRHRIKEREGGKGGGREKERERH